MDVALVEEKVARAREVVADAEADAWLTFCRETDEVHEPCLPYVLGFDVVWPTAVVVGPTDSAVVLGRHDAPNARELGVHEVYAYDESIAEPLRAVLDGMDAGTVALNYDRDDNVADGLTHGLYRRLTDLLPDREFVSARDVVGRVRGLKSPTERDRIVAAAEETLSLLADAAETWTPATTERDVVDYLHGRMREAGHGAAWSREYCPTVHAGAGEVGHTLAGEATVDEGELLHVDFGVVREGYAADLQRLWVRGEPDAELVAAFEDVRAAIEAGYEALDPGVVGAAVDAAAREALTDRGWSAFDHAFGHQVGRAAHDGGTLLGPRWDRYGDSVAREVRAGELYTMELGADTPYGYVGQEEMVHVTADGPEFVVPPQTDLWALA